MAADFIVASVAQELEELQRQLSEQHACIVDGLRAKCQQLTTSDKSEARAWPPFLRPTGESTMESTIEFLEDDLQLQNFQPKFTGSLDLPLHEQEQVRADSNQTRLSSASYAHVGSIDASPYNTILPDDEVSEVGAKHAGFQVRWSPSVKMSARQEWDCRAELAQRSQDGEMEVHDLLKDCIETQGIEMLDLVRGLDAGSKRVSVGSSHLHNHFVHASNHRINDVQHHEEEKVPWIPFDPYSVHRLFWDLMGISFVLYEMVFIPIMLLVTPANSVGETMDIVCNVYWTADILLTFVTCVEIEGELQRDFRKIAQHYARSWLALDVLIVVPEWIRFCMQNGSSGIKLLRILKVARLLRLLRVLKIGNAIRKHLSRFNSLTVLNLMKLVQMMLAFLMLNHFVACGWYFIGHETGNGWLYHHADSDDIPNGYALALHWAIAQFHGTSDVTPGNKQERVFAICMQVVGLLTLSVFVSLTTNIILQEQHSRKRIHGKMENLRMYFLHCSVSSNVMLRVKSYMQAAADEKDWMDDFAVLKGLPPYLLKRVLLEARAPTLQGHCLFAWLKVQHEAAFRTICHTAFSKSRSLAETAVFEIGDPWEKIIFVEDGSLRYLPCDDTQKQDFRFSTAMRPVKTRQVGSRVSRRMWLCELALWVKGWQSKGDLIAETNTSLLCLGSATLSQELSSFPDARLEVLMYVHGFLQEVASQGLGACMLDDTYNKQQ